MATFVDNLVNGTLTANTPGTVANPPVRAPAPANNGVYWNGADGNVYVKGAQGTNVAGRSDSNTAGYWGGKGYSQIADPNAPQSSTSTPAGKTGGGNGGGTNTSTISANPANAPVYQDRSNDIAVQNAGLGALDSQTATGIGAIDKALGSLKGGYADETKANEANYGNESNSNLSTQQGGKQTAYVRAAQGRSGLLATLSSIGALSGDSIELANRAVQNGANEDLSGVNHTFATNQSGLDTAIGTYRREDKLRNDEADAQAENARTNARGQSLQTRQSFLQNLVKDYSDQGDKEQAKNYTDQVAALYPQIAASNVPNANLVTKNAAYTPASLATYLNQNNTAVTSTPAQGTGPNNLPTLSAVNTSRKDQFAPAVG